MWRFAPILLVLIAPAVWAQRVTIPLNGTWNVAESIGADEIPAAFGHRAPVPGLTNLARPAFPGVDQFESRELIDNQVRKGLRPKSDLVRTSGVSRQKRNYFWYETTFSPTVEKQLAILQVNKAQFGTAVWLNGKKIGEHAGCFTSGYFNLTAAMHWHGANQLIIRIGAHPGVLPPEVTFGTDFEKLKWTPGIYDSVSLHLSDNPIIEAVQVAPRIASSDVVIQARVKNYSARDVTFELAHIVRRWKSDEVAARSPREKHRLRAGEEATLTTTVNLPGARLWSPEHPFLYVVDTSTAGDTRSTRFGMREFRFDTATKRAYLNGKLYFLRGSNITLHRFFEDPKAAGLPWDEAWVRRLLVDIPKRLHWNSFRFCIGPVPDRWLEIADEAGLLIQNEFFIWTGERNFPSEWTAENLILQFSEWMRDNWNHPSVAIWDASNETRSNVLRDKVIPAVRNLDLSNRPWDNGYSLPSGADDPVEDHPYLFNRVVPGRANPFKPADLETAAHYKQASSPHPTGHAPILNEYGWLWVNRDGSPTLLTQEVYDTLLGPGATNEQRLSLNAYLVGGLTEFWRSRRNYAGVMHFVYLSASFPGVFTSDHFRDVEKLELHREAEDYLREAFRPLGVYLNFWQETQPPGARRSFAISLVNDEPEAVNGNLTLSVHDAAGTRVAGSDAPFALPAFGQHTWELTLQLPAAPGEYWIRASAQPQGWKFNEPTVSRRKVKITPAGGTANKP